MLQCFEMGFSLPPSLLAFLYTRAVVESMAYGGLLAGGPLPLAVDKLLWHLLPAVSHKPLAAHAAERLHRGTLAWLQGSVKPHRGWDWVRLHQRAPHDWSKTALQIYDSAPDASKEPDWDFTLPSWVCASGCVTGLHLSLGCSVDKKKQVPSHAGVHNGKPLLGA